MTCPDCGAPVEEGADLCLECGEPLGDSVVARMARAESGTSPSTADARAPAPPLAARAPAPPVDARAPAAPVPPAVAEALRRARARAAAEVALLRCPGCGVPTAAARCPGCGARLRSDD